MSDSYAPQPNELIPVPVGTAISPLIQPFVTTQPLFNAAAVTPNPAFQAGTTAPPRMQLLRPTGPALDRNYQRNLTTLTSKYRDLSPLIARINPTVRNAIIGLDSQRVARGASPLTREQTVLAIQSAQTNTQATPQPHRNPWNVLGNVGADLSDVLKMFTPEGVRGLVHEVTEIPHIAERIHENEQHGMSPLQALLRAPGIRLVPGTYTAANVLGGRAGISEALSHPLMTALDVLPYATKLAGSTAVAEATQAARVAEAERLGVAAPRPRPITAVVANRLGAEGEVVRSPFGQFADTFRNETRLGQAMDAFGGARSRMVSRMAGTLDQRLKSLMLGFGKPQNVVESFGPRIADLFDRYSQQYPFLSKAAKGPEADAARAQFVAEIQRHPENLDPAFVNEYRDLQVDMGRYTTAQEWTAMFDGELYPRQVAEALRKSRASVDHGQRMIAFYNEYINPSGNLDAAAFRRMADDVGGIANKAQRLEAARALENTLDAYGIDPALLRGERTKISWPSWRAKLDTILADPATVLKPRATADELVAKLRTQGAERQAALLEKALLDGDRAEVSRRINNLANRKTPNVASDPAFAADVRSMARRTDFENTVGHRYSTERVESRRRVFEHMHEQAAPARFHALLEDELKAQTPGRLRAAAEGALSHTLSAEEAARLARAVEQKVWSDVPGIDAVEVQRTMNTLEREITATWKDLRANGHDPMFVHKVSPSRANATLHNRIGPARTSISQARERVLDLTPGINDLQVSLTHQATELLSRQYSEQFIHQVIDAVGVPEAELRRRYMDEAQRRGTPLADAEVQYQQMRDHAYERFNPESEGYSWGGADMQKYRDDAYYIPKAIGRNLQRYTKTPSLFSAISEPLTSAFRYQVIGLSPSVIINNFFSNAVAATAEIGPRFLTKWGQARKMLEDIGSLSNEELKGVLLADEPYMEHLGREQWMASRSGQKFMSGVNARQAFEDSVFSRTAGTVKAKLDAVVHQTMKAQRWGDNVYRSMIYLDQLEQGLKKGLTQEAAENGAMEQVRQILVDYRSFTPVERSAMREIVPFYSYMGHAARFIARYPLNHPLRTSIAASIARAEKERLGALPGSFLSMLPITGIGASGAQTFLNLRPFDPFGDQGDLLSVAGWLSAMNPAIQIALRQVGVVRGESDLYPTLRYDPETGRMVAAHPSLIGNVVNTVLPRASLVTSLLGLNSDYNQIRANDPAAANRSLLSMAGLPRAWRQYNVPQEIMRAEVNRQTAASDVLNTAISTGDWSEAMRYPSLQAYYEQMQQLTPQQVAAMSPAAPDQIAQSLSRAVR